MQICKRKPYIAKSQYGQYIQYSFISNPIAMHSIKIEYTALVGCYIYLCSAQISCSFHVLLVKIGHKTQYRFPSRFPRTWEGPVPIPDDCENAVNVSSLALPNAHFDVANMISLPSAGTLVGTWPKCVTSGSTAAAIIIWKLYCPLPLLQQYSFSSGEMESLSLYCSSPNFPCFKVSWFIKDVTSTDFDWTNTHTALKSLADLWPWLQFFPSQNRTGGGEKIFIVLAMSTNYTGPVMYWDLTV